MSEKEKYLMQYKLFMEFAGEPRKGSLVGVMRQKCKTLLEAKELIESGYFATYLPQCSEWTTQIKQLYGQTK